jgi:hypothetical protein
MVNMYYKKHDKIPPLPDALKKACVNHGTLLMRDNQPMIVKYGQYETKNTNSIAYMTPGTEYDKTRSPTGKVGFYGLPPELSQQIVDFYKNVNNPLIQSTIYFLQVVAGGTYVAPHIDDSSKRTQGLLYLLKAGGPDVRTRWYTIKEEFKHLSLKNAEYSAIPYDRLNIAEDHRLEEDTWHWMDFNQIHSVENQLSTRFALYGFVA